MAEEEKINQGRRWFLRNTGAAAAGVAASTMMPAGVLQALTANATGFTLDGLRFERALEALLEDMFLPSEQLSNMQQFFSTAPTARDAYEFARNFGSPQMLEANMNNMLAFVSDTAHELDAEKALNPAGVRNFLDQLPKQNVYDQFHHIMPDSSGSELVQQLRTTIGQDAHAYNQTQHAIADQVRTTYGQLSKQFAAFKAELRAGEADYARDISEQSHYYADMASARKAGGYPIPEHFKNRPESYVGSHDESGEQRHYCGTVAPRRHINIIKN